jgi:hypothetical protein
MIGFESGNALSRNLELEKLANSNKRLLLGPQSAV